MIFFYSVLQYIYAVPWVRDRTIEMEGLRRVVGEQNEENQCELDAVLPLVKLDKLTVRHSFVKTLF